MTENADHGETACGISPWLRALHVIVLCAFALTEPILAALSHQAVYRHDQGIGWIELSGLLIVVCLLLPLGAVLLDRLTMQLARRVSGRGRNAVLGLLCCLVLLSLLRPCARIDWLVQTRSAWMVSLGVAVPGAWLFARCYERFGGLRFWLTISSLGLFVFPGSFAWQLRQEIQLQRQEAAHPRVEVRNPIPLVMIVFDEFSGTSLLNERLEIDTAHFPNFARLASHSTWYRQATTVHARTDVAVPAILSGQFPAQQRGPTEANYPGNLLQLIHTSGDYDMSVFEPITRLCPAVLARVRPVVSPRPMLRISNLLMMLASVYPRLLFPGDTPVDFPVIPKAWFGMSDELSDSQRHLKTGLFHYQPGLDRDVQLDHCLDCLRPTERPLFCFFHTLLPHLPWTHFPSGRHYIENGNGSFFADGGLGDLSETWPADEAIVLRNEHRYLLQVEFTDRFLGRVLDKLEAAGLLDRCLLVVTADHGVSFRPSRSRRVPDAENIADILSVPLFIKRPGQSVGRIDDRNVESIDLLPTVAEELGITLIEPVDGASVTQERRRPRKTLYFETGMTVVEPKVPHLEAAVGRRLAAFGGGSWDVPPRSTASHPDWHGRRVQEFPLVTAPASEIPDLELTSPVFRLDHDRITELLVAGAVVPHARQESPMEIVLVAGGIICDSCRTYRGNRGGEWFSFLIPESVAKASQTEIELFLVKEGGGEGPQLVRLRNWLLQPDDS